MSLRSLLLHHNPGILRTIPFGVVQHLTRISHDWMTMKLPLPLAQETGAEPTRKLVEKPGEQHLQDREIGAKFILPLGSEGVIQTDDTTMTVRAGIMKLPGGHWVTRKWALTEMRELTRREGSGGASREGTVHIAGSGDEAPYSDSGRPRVRAANRYRQSAGREVAARRTVAKRRAR